ncbi:MAG: S4 domain-containing protein, partial [Pseudomonadota bacterium]
MTAQTHTLTTGNDDRGTRLDRWLTQALHARGAELTRSRIQALITDGHVHLDEGPVLAPATKVKTGQTYYVAIPAATPTT